MSRCCSQCSYCCFHGRCDRIFSLSLKVLCAQNSRSLTSTAAPTVAPTSVCPTDTGALCFFGVCPSGQHCAVNWIGAETCHCSDSCFESCQDSDYCLTGRGGWDGWTCTSGSQFCTSANTGYAQDMHACCPVTCSSCSAQGCTAVSPNKYCNFSGTSTCQSIANVQCRSICSRASHRCLPESVQVSLRRLSVNR